MTPRRWIVPRCIAGHHLSSVTSFYRSKNGVRRCIQCEITRHPSGKVARKARRNTQDRASRATGLLTRRPMTDPALAAWIDHALASEQRTA
jgi:hypothetical protein